MIIGKRKLEKYWLGLGLFCVLYFSCCYFRVLFSVLYIKPQWGENINNAKYWCHTGNQSKIESQQKWTREKSQQKARYKQIGFDQICTWDMQNRELRIETTWLNCQVIQQYMLHHCSPRHSALYSFLLPVTAYSNKTSSSGLLVLGCFCPCFHANQALGSSLISKLVLGVTGGGIELRSMEGFIDGDVIVKCLCLLLLHMGMYICRTGHFENEPLFLCFGCSRGYVHIKLW